MLYGAECWPTKRRHVQQLSVAEMHMLRWICGHTRMDRVRNDDIRDRYNTPGVYHHNYKVNPMVNMIVSTKSARTKPLNKFLLAI